MLSFNCRIRSKPISSTTNGAIYYSINKAEKKEKEAREYTAGALWVLIVSSILLTISVFSNTHTSR